MNLFCFFFNQPGGHGVVNLQSNLWTTLNAETAHILSTDRPSTCPRSCPLPALIALSTVALWPAETNCNRTATPNHQSGPAYRHNAYPRNPGIVTILSGRRGRHHSDVAPRA